MGMYYDDNKAPVTQDDMDAFEKIEESPRGDIRTYVQSNVQHYGKGPEGWFSTTQTARTELYGAAVIGMAKNVLDNMAEDEEPTDEPKV